MPSPFPGMDPYLESPAIFHDLHQALIVEMRRQLVRQVRGRYVAQTDTSVYLHELSADERYRIGRPDVSISRDAPAPGVDKKAPASAPSTAYLPHAVDVLELPFLKLLDASSREVVTVIELISPNVKLKAEDRAVYLAKRGEVLRSSANLVEIDLLRAGGALPLVSAPESDYRVLVSRPGDRPRVDLWPISLQERLPTIPIPLAPGDVDAQLDLQAGLSSVYDDAGYAEYVYAREPIPPLEAKAQSWADAVRASGS